MKHTVINNNLIYMTCTIEDVLRYSAILHAAHMANPEQCVHGGETGAVHDLSVGTLSLQLMPRIRWKLRRWKLFSFRSCLL